MSSSPQSTPSAVAAAVVVAALGTPTSASAKASTPKTGAGKKKSGTPTPRAQILEEVPVNTADSGIDVVNDVPVMAESLHSPSRHSEAPVATIAPTDDEPQDAVVPSVQDAQDAAVPATAPTVTDTVAPVQFDSNIASFCVSPARQVADVGTPTKASVAAAVAASGTPAVIASPFKAPSPKSATKKTASRTPSRSQPVVTAFVKSPTDAVATTPVPPRSPAVSAPRSPFPRVSASQQAIDTLAASEAEAVREAIASVSQPVVVDEAHCDTVADAPAAEDLPKDADTTDAAVVVGVPPSTTMEEVMDDLVKPTTPSVQVVATDDEVVAM